MKVAFFGVKEWEREAIEKQIANLPAYGVGIFEEEVQDKLEVAKDYEIISTFIYSQMDEKVLCKLPKLKMIATRSTGVDHIDCGVCTKRCVEVKNVPEYGTHTVAEYTFALMLAICKKVVEAKESVEHGEFTPQGLTGIDLRGKTLGVVGVGKIGQEVVKLGRAFGMKILGVEKKPDLVMAKKLGYTPVTLEECLRKSDILTLHVPSIPQTRHLINRQNIQMMKKGAYLINTCRGAVVESAAILWALNKGILAGAGLDVIEEEDKIETISSVMGKTMHKEDLQDLLSFHMLRDRDDVVLTPHNAFNTKEAIERIVATTVENILEFMQKKATV